MSRWPGCTGTSSTWFGCLCFRLSTCCQLIITGYSESKLARTLMVDTKQREVTTLNMVLLAMAGLSLAVAAWDVVSNGFRAGTDDVFLILVCLTLALLFAVPPLIWARANGMLKNPFAEEAVPEGGAEMEMAHEEHGEHGGSDRQNVFVWGGLLGLTAFEVLLAYI